MRTIPERDWKIFRDLHPRLLQRFCDRTLLQAQTEIGRPGISAHKRYLAVYRLMRDRDQELARGFNDLRRSTAMGQISVLYSMGLFTDDDLARFGPEIHQFLDMFERGPEA